jgi:SAM-dependent methyltransferase
MIDIGQIATNLERRERDIWFSKDHSTISYPNDGNAFCYAVEDKSFWFTHRNKCIIAIMRLYPPAGIVLDVGGGNGFVSLALRQAGISSVVVEPGVTGVENAHARGLEPVICATLQGAGFKHQAIPAVGLFDVLEHIEDEDGFLRLIKEILIPNGRLYITVPAYQLLWSVADEDAGHYKRYTTSALKTKLEAIGFTIDFQSYFFWALVAPTFLFRSVPSWFGLRKGGELKSYEKELAQSSDWVSRLLRLLLDPELGMLGRKRPIPFGGSCLVVARVTPGRSGH